MTGRRWSWLPVVAAVLLAAGCGSSHSGSQAATGGGSGSSDSITYQVIDFTDDGSVVGLDDGSLWSVVPADQSVVTGHWNLDNQLVKVGDGGHMLVDVEEGGAHDVRVSRIGSVLDKNEYGHVGDNTLAGIGHGAYFAGGADGSVLVLEDGSVWSVLDPNDQQTAAQWADGDDVVVHKASGRSYRLVDTDVESSVTAHYVGQESS